MAVVESYFHHDQHHLYELREAVSVIIAQNHEIFHRNYIPDSLSETLALDMGRGGGLGASSSPSGFTTSW